MRRIYIVRALQPLVSRGALAAFVFIVALWGIGREVWVAQVLANGPQDPFGHTQYLFYAFNHTRLIVQGLVLLTLAAFIYLARELVRGVSSAFTPVRA